MSNRGVTLPSTLIQPTPLEPSAEQANRNAGQGSEPTALEAKPQPRRRRRSTTTVEGRGHKLSLPDAVFSRLQLEAFQRRKSASAIAAAILDKNLPKLRIERDD